MHRQFPSHEIFASKGGSGQQDLYKVLKAYSLLKPEIGYCQGQAPLASVLLMVMPAEHAFWSLVSLCDIYLDGYFSPGLETLQLHGDMLFALLRKFSPSAHKLLKKQKIEPVLYMTEWFMCLFSRTLPWPAVLRVWDMFMCEGIIVIFKVAIVLLGVVLFHQKKSCTAMYETLQILKHIPKNYMEEKNLIPKITKLDLTESDLKREHAIQSNCRRIKKIQEKKKRIESGKLEKRQEAEKQLQREQREQRERERELLASTVASSNSTTGREVRQNTNSSVSVRSRSSYRRDSNSNYNGNGHKKITSNNTSDSRVRSERNHYSREPLNRLDSHSSSNQNHSRSGRSGRIR